jgi:adenylate cyclase
MAKLTYRDAAGVLRTFPIRGRVSIGRHPAQDIQILDRVVSKAHCVVSLDSGRYSLQDIGSRNGTLVNGVRISGTKALTHGDEVTVGSTLITFVADAPEDRLMNRITFHDTAGDSAIRSKVSGRLDEGFLPADQIRDTSILRRDYEKLRIANALQKDLGPLIDSESLLSTILDKAFELFPADHGVILIYKPEDKTFVPKVYKSRLSETDGQALRISQTILREVVEEKAAVLSHDAMTDSRFSGSNSIILEGIKSTVSVPLLYEETLLGVIHLDSRNALGAFSEKDLQILTGFARQAAINMQHRELLKRMEEELAVRANLQRLLSPQLIDQVVNGQVEIKQGGEERTTTVLFADIRGFTSLAERLPAQVIVSLLNDYFEIMVDVIFAQQGTLDKFVGDEIMALWGAPLDVDNPEIRATECALSMQEGLAQFNELRRMEFEIAIESGTLPADAEYEKLQIGIGINSGRVIAGYIGSSKSLSYTVVGDPVNVASRLCSVAKPDEIVIGRATYSKLQDRFRCVALPPQQLKGKSESVDLFRVVGRTGEPEKIPARLMEGEGALSTGEAWNVPPGPARGVTQAVGAVAPPELDSSLATTEARSKETE